MIGATALPAQPYIAVTWCTYASLVFPSASLFVHTPLQSITLRIHSSPPHIGVFNSVQTIQHSHYSPHNVAALNQQVVADNLVQQGFSRCHKLLT